ncbi:hypothetical protein [uncultured Fibrobacter sp.]|uniref:hypothetical protein n=1 Tax=uncultured Fibrobacter sp. TaxID=261512 RepID=UPI001565847B|nr:hypothetical protein [uncultured Fibrobacter sp.]
MSLAYTSTSVSRLKPLRSDKMPFGRLILILAVLLLFCGCSNFQGAKALEFFSHLDESGRWKNSERADFEGRMLSEKVACVKADVFVLDTVSGKLKLDGKERVCWDDYGIETEHIIEDSLGKTISSRKTVAEKGVVLSRTVENFAPLISRRNSRASYLLMTETKDEGAITRVYTLQNDSGKVFEVLYRMDKDKMVSAQINYPFLHKLKIDYGEDGLLHSISDKRSSNAYRIDFVDGRKKKEEKVTYHGEMYSYRLKAMDSQGKPIEVIFSDDFCGKQIHRKYAYHPDGTTKTIWENGVSRNLIYENGRLVREEYYDYGGKLRWVVDIVTDENGNVMESSYVRKTAGDYFDKVIRQYKYTYTCR